MTGRPSLIPWLPGPHEPGEYVSIPLHTGLIGGRPGMGKSLLLHRLIQAVAEAEGPQSPRFPADPAGEEHSK